MPQWPGRDIRKLLERLRQDVQTMESLSPQEKASILSSLDRLIEAYSQRL
jgi:hypothetical protein